MNLPYTNHFPEAVAIAGCASGTALTAVVWARSLRSRWTTVAFSGAIWLAALVPVALPALRAAFPQLELVALLQASALLATMAMLFGQPLRWLKVVAPVGQALLLALTLYVRESDYELGFLHLLWCGLLTGCLLSWMAPRAAQAPPHFDRAAARKHAIHDLVIFAATVPLAFLVTNLVFGRLTFNGDEIANTFQADVYGHFRASAPIPPCPAMFENYWVFRHDGHAFSQYTPGWPLFMAVFSRLGIIPLAGPVMAGILAVGIARLSRRLASGLGSGPDSSERIVAIAGVLGALAMLGPAVLMNGASRFSHPMVCACFAWAVESLCVISEPGSTRARVFLYGLLLGAAASLGVATRPADGATLGVGVFLYFVWALSRRRISWFGFLGTALGFVTFGGLTLIILRLQLGHWFQTGYTIAASIHPEAGLRLSWPQPNELKYGIPLATGSYCWWPAAPALGIAGLVRALGGRERRVAFMLVTSSMVFVGFYFFVEFGRGHDDGLGPRYLLPLVVLMGSGGAALLAPLFAKSVEFRFALPTAWLRLAAPAVAVLVVMVWGVIAIAPLIYPVARREYEYSTAPLRGAAKLGLKNAIVIIERGRSTADEWNLAQNQPMDPNPSVLFLSRHSHADDVCARRAFPGRKWYRATFDETLVPY